MATTMRDYSEKRDFHRMQVNSEVMLTDTDGKQYKGVCKDLSGTGMQLYMDTAMPVGTELQTLLPSTNEKFPPFETVIEILRCEPDGDGYLMGASIKQVKR